jgi:hypothetical protein
VIEHVKSYFPYLSVLLAYCVFFSWLVFILWRKRGVLHCEDLITNRNGKVSRVALAQLSGVLIASWIPIHMAINASTDATILGVCLAYLAAIEGFSKWLAHKEEVAKITPPEPSVLK